MADLRVSQPSSWTTWPAEIFGGLVRILIVVEMVHRLRIVP
jgi:hypothetical protein